ncbi:MAG: hypothetical protein HKP58_05815, partial [Desulfatitalea sp.]|nr:DUF1302 domain-containing protein [Desulfatitalea sp.]NNJ99911.1 hypothetical protein [Desulfatitalea sp.]
MVKKRGDKRMKARINLIGLFFTLLLSIMIISPCPSSATEMSLFGKPLRFYGLIAQSAQYGWQDEYDTYQGIKQAPTTAILEGDYALANSLRVYTMISLTGDLAYVLNNDSDDWKRRQFDKSDDLAFDDEYWRILREFHVSWTSDQAMLRVGKQIVSWGEMTGFRLLDQINPVDGQRGPGDLEFETTILPIWMVRTDYSFPLRTETISDVNLQVIYNPNPDSDIYTRSASPGNDKGGVWAPYSEIGSPALLLGSRTLDLTKPDEWT